MAEKVVHSRDGVKHVYTLEDGEEFTFIEEGEHRGSIIVTHPDRRPKLVLASGEELPLALDHIEVRTHLLTFGQAIIWKDGK